MVPARILFCQLTLLVVFTFFFSSSAADCTSSVHLRHPLRVALLLAVVLHLHLLHCYGRPCFSEHRTDNNTSAYKTGTKLRLLD